MKKKRSGKRFLRLAATALLVYAAWLGWQIAGFRTYGAAPAGDPTPSGLEIKGAYHIHSKLSDGRATPDKIARLASSEGLDFVILTDHGSPNIPSCRSQGWKDGVLVLAGSELSVSRGHLVALGFREPRRDFSQKTEDAMDEIRSLGGFGIIAHPYAKVRWSWGDPGDSPPYSGIEIVNMDHMLKTNFWRMLPYAPALLIKPELAVLKLIEHPGINIEKWDERNLRSRIYGYFGADAHLLYRGIFSAMCLHLLLDEPLGRDFEKARGQVLAALRRGRFYNALKGAAEARGFRFWAEAGGRRVSMGESASAAIPLELRVQADFPFSKEVRVVRDGRKIMSAGGSLAMSINQPGVYRVEVYLREKSPLDAGTPWIVSNPIFVRPEVNP